MQDFRPVQNYKTVYSQEKFPVCMIFLYVPVISRFLLTKNLAYITLVAVKSLTGTANKAFKYSNYLNCPYIFFPLGWTKKKSDQISIADDTTGSHVVYMV